jgi:hypothetical protein
MNATTSIVMAAALIAGVAQAGVESADSWSFGMPDTGLLPSFAKAEFFSQMKERHGDASDLSMQSYGIMVPFLDPRKTGSGDTHINFQLDAKVTVINAGGSLRLRNENMYNLALPMTFITSMPSGNTWTYGVAPELASDSKAMEKGLDLTAYAFYSVKASDTFSYSLGLALSPRFVEYTVLPIVRFDWKPCELWTVSLKDYDLKAMYQASERLVVGPFLSARGGIWAVDTDRGARFLRIRSLVLGAAVEYDFSRPGQTKRVLSAAIGSTLATHAQFCERGSMDGYENHHYKPGFYASAEVDFRF